MLGTSRHGSFVVLRLEVGGWTAAEPGQFALLRRCGSCRFLPRAFSVHAQDVSAAASGTGGASGEAVLEFLVAPIGPGSTELAEAAPGERIDVCGPLGRGFPRPAEVVSETGRLVVAAGGVGIAPFRLLLEELGSLPADDVPVPLSDVVVLMGFRDRVQAEGARLLTEVRRKDRAAEPAYSPAFGPALRFEVATEDGSLGRKGLVTALLEKELQSGDVVFACGAGAMCRAAWGLCGAVSARSAWFSLEAPMACGSGSCHGCVIRMADGTFAKVCRRGPVFRGDEVFREGGAADDLWHPPGKGGAQPPGERAAQFPGEGAAQ